MAEHPILFSAPMIRAILEGRKSQTRRVIKPVRGFEQHNICKPDMAADPWAVWWHGDITDRVGCLQTCPYGVPGDHLYVREGVRLCGADDTGAPLSEPPVWYLADGPCDQRLYPHRRTCRFMPRWASRITLEITDVRVQRVNDITDADAIAEGCTNGGCVYCGSDEPCGCETPRPDHRETFVHLWNSINEKRGLGWFANPWVWAISFKAVKP